MPPCVAQLLMRMKEAWRLVRASLWPLPKVPFSCGSAVHALWATYQLHIRKGQSAPCIIW